MNKSLIFPVLLINAMKKLLAILLFAALAPFAAAQEFVLEMLPDKTGAEVQPTMYGLFFEDINFAADGGLYAELVKNRSFEFRPDRLAGWSAAGDVRLLDGGPFERNPHYVRLSCTGHHEKRTAIENEGFWGMAFKAGEEYRFSVWARCPDGAGSTVRVSLTEPASGADSQFLAEADLTVDSPEWKKYTLTLTPSRSTSAGALRISLPYSRPAVDLEHISLFPADTYKGRENGLRRDIAEALEGLHPGVFRFPGGCIVEGTDPATRYQWKNSVGPVENRPLNENRWQTTFANRLFPDYFQSLGLGFYEYFRLCEDLGAEPLPVLNVGLVCQYQNSPDRQIPLDSLQTFIDDAIDLIEFANGPADSRWGSVRAAMGHPEPFNLKLLAVGNEQWGPEYVERLEPAVAAIRKAHPEIKLIGSSGPDSEGDKFDYLWPEMRRLKVDLVDEHFYRNEDWFLSHGNRYDSYDRKGPKVFAGEYACHTSGAKRNNYRAAICEAAFMTGLERNADVVHMATYAPLLANVNGWQWRPDLIWFDNSAVIPSVSYYVQQLYAANRGTHVVPLTCQGKPLAGNEGQGGLFASAVCDRGDRSYIVKVVNTDTVPHSIAVRPRWDRKASVSDTVGVITLTSDTPDADNTFDNPRRIVPVESHMHLGADRSLSDIVPPLTFRIYRINLNN